jgi:hypothetical protein
MRETWLRPNRRAAAFACVLPAFGIAIGLFLATIQTASSWRVAGWSLALAGAGVVALLVREMVRPRVAYRDGLVLFYLRSGEPFEVPANSVEAFFLGQGPATLPGRLAPGEETVNLVARLSQRESEWAHQAVKPALGHWCDGYVTIRGTWCEPLGTEVVRRLNRRLKEVKVTRGES